MTAFTHWKYVTDGGLETDLIFNHGAELPEFAAYPLLWTDEGRALLRQYYAGYADIAAAAGAGLLIETPTYRASTEDFCRLIRAAGKRPVQRDTLYRRVRAYD